LYISSLNVDILGLLLSANAASLTLVGSFKLLVD